MSWQVENIARYVLSLGPVHVNLAKLLLGSDILLSSLYSSVEVVVCTWTESRELGHPVKLCGIYGIYGHILIWYLWVPVRKKQVLLMYKCDTGGFRRATTFYRCPHTVYMKLHEATDHCTHATVYYKQGGLLPVYECYMGYIMLPSRLLFFLMYIQNLFLPLRESESADPDILPVYRMIPFSISCWTAFVHSTNNVV